MRELRKDKGGKSKSMAVLFLLGDAQGRGVQVSGRAEPAALPLHHPLDSPGSLPGKGTEERVILKNSLS